MPYEQTPVSVGKSQEQIAKLLGKFKVKGHRFTSLPSEGTLEFVREVDEKQHIPYRITVRPKINPAYISTSQWDRAERQVWRVCYCWLKAKLEAIDFGLVEFEQDFLPYMLVADGQGRQTTVDALIFERLANRLSPSKDDPFGGMKVLPPPAP